MFLNPENMDLWRHLEQSIAGFIRTSSSVSLSHLEEKVSRIETITLEKICLRQIAVLKINSVIAKPVC